MAGHCAERYVLMYHRLTVPEEGLLEAGATGQGDPQEFLMTLFRKLRDMSPSRFCMFDSSTVVTRACPRCRAATVVEETVEFYNLYPQGVNQDVISLLYQSLKDKVDVTCGIGSCKYASSQDRQRKMITLPRVLRLHVVRDLAEVTGPQRVEHLSIEIPLTFNMRGKTSCLQAAVFKTGSNVNTGHYVCIVRVDKQFWAIDNDVVKHVGSVDTYVKDNFWIPVLLLYTVNGDPRPSVEDPRLPKKQKLSQKSSIATAVPKEALANPRSLPEAVARTFPQPDTAPAIVPGSSGMLRSGKPMSGTLGTTTQTDAELVDNAVMDSSADPGDDLDDTLDQALKRHQASASKTCTVHASTGVVSTAQKSRPASSAGDQEPHIPPLSTPAVLQGPPKAPSPAQPHYVSLSKEDMRLVLAPLISDTNRSIDELQARYSSAAKKSPLWSLLSLRPREKVMDASRMVHYREALQAYILANPSTDLSRARLSTRMSAYLKYITVSISTNAWWTNFLIGELLSEVERYLPRKQTSSGGSFVLRTGLLSAGWAGRAKYVPLALV